MEKYSWSRLASFNQCGRKYELSYIEGYEKIPSADNEGRLFGTAIHAGFEKVLVSLFHGLPMSEAIKKAIDASRQSITDASLPNKMRWNWEKNVNEPDIEYYQMIEDLYNNVPKFLNYYLPRIGLGTKYVPVSVADVLPDFAEAHIPMVEYDFSLLIDEDKLINGRIDAVLRDVDSGELVLFDWKSRKAFPRDDMALIDGQLHLYAAVLNLAGGNISRVCMAQMRTGLPKPAELSKKDNLPLTGRESYDTTWDFWVNSLPQAVDHEFYREVMTPKMKQHQPDFWRPVFGFVTEVSSKLTITNTLMQIDNIRMVIDTGTMAGVYSHTTCNFCEFQRLCANGLRYGGDVSEILERDYQRRVGYEEVVEESNE